MVEEKGYRTTIEEPVPNGRRVDVGLELGGKKTACEISVTSTDEQELSNIEKCLRAGYERVIICSPERRALDRIKAMVIQRIGDSDNKSSSSSSQMSSSLILRQKLPIWQVEKKEWRVIK